MKVLMSLGLVCFGSSGLGQFASSVYNIDQNNFKKCFCGKATVIIHHSTVVNQEGVREIS